ncbi:MAG: hypothetical protein EBW49_09940, partial [Betaproteobacteria bacterium]|nr:hypothetical protein [Betaproteobacteria bacterium]
MNLSALNPPQANNLTNPVTDTNATGIEAARFKSEALTGADFASYLHNQVQSLKHTQRPTFAVSNGALPPAAPKTDTRPQPSKSDDQPASAKSATSDAQKASQHRHASAKADRADQSNDRTDSDEKVADRQSEDQVLVAQDAQNTAGDATAGDATAGDATAGDATAGDATAGGATDLAQEALLNSADKAADLASDNTQASALAAQDASLTTIAVSDKLQIITTANTAASEQSVADFALAMGLDPSQVKTLFGEAAANAAAAKLANSSPSTQQILGINSLPSFGMNATANGPSKALGADTLAGSGLSVSMDSPVSTADFQALQAQAPTVQADTQDLLGKMNNLQIQLGSAQAQMASAASSPVSTLAVLSMMDTQLRAEDIESLKSEHLSLLER